MATQEQAQDAPVIPLEVVRAVLWFFGDRNLGVDPGHFVNSLLLTISRADTNNIEKLRLGFPEHVFAMRAVQGTHWGFDWLRDRAKRGTASEDGLELYPEVQCMVHEGEHQRTHECIFPFEAVQS